MKRNLLHSLFLLPAAGFGLPLLPGCTPQVYTHVTRSYPPLAHGDTVAVFAPDQTPPSAEVLGEVSVQNSGFTHPFTYAHAVALASDAVVSVGGNGLHVTEHKASSFVYSGRRRITGQMLRLPDSVCRELLTDTLYTFLAGRKPVAAQAGKGATTARTGKNTFYANAGYAFILSKVLLPASASGNPRQGFDFNVGYNHTPHNIWGFGLRYARYVTSIDLHGPYTYRDRIALDYFAPEVTVRSAGPRWAYNLAFGMGYASYSEQIGQAKEVASGYGVHLALDLEYRITPYLGIGLNLYEIVAQFSDERLSVGGDSAVIGRIGLAGGLRVRF